MVRVRLTLLIACLFLVTHPTFADEFTDGGINYIVNNDYASVIVAPGNYSGDFVIPSYVWNPNIEDGEGYSVTGIAANAFKNCTGLTSVTYTGSSTLHIGSAAFSGCWNLKTISIPSFWLNGDSTFYKCSSLKEIDCSEQSGLGKSTFEGCYNLPTVSLPGTISEIGDRCFYGCTSLTEVTIPNPYSPWSVRIGKGAFWNCSKLKTFSVGSNYNAIELADSAFGYCRALEKVELPNAVTKIGRDAFYLCEALQTITIPASVKEIGARCFASCSALKTVIFQNEMETIPDSVFNGCKHLISLALPNGCKTIGQFTFWGCTMLSKVSLPNTVKSIGRGAFGFCPSLHAIELGDSIKSIGKEAFVSCYNLGKVTLPSQLKSIGDQAFYTSNLTEITCNAFIPALATNNTFYSSLYSQCKLNVPALTASQYRTADVWKKFANINPFDRVVEIDSIQYVIDTQDFKTCVVAKGANMEKISIPQKVSIDDNDYVVDGISDNAFRNCDKIKQVVLGGSQAGSYVTIIGKSAFQGCSNLTGIFNWNICATEVEDSAFYGCNNLTSVEGIKRARRSTFENCSSLTNISYPALSHAGDYCFRGCSSLKTMNFSGEKNAIGTSCFEGCTSLMTVTCKADSIYIGENSFRDCAALTTLSCEGEGVYFGNNSFRDCTALTTVTCKNDSLMEIGEGGFQGCSALEKFTFCGDSVSVGNSAFRDCEALETFNSSFYDKNLKEWQFKANVGDNSFQNCVFLYTTNIIPQKIGKAAFAYCYTLNHMTLDSLVEIPDSAFYGCESLQLGNNSAFQLPAKLKEIGAWAFAKCTKLKTVYIYDGNLETLGTGAFAENARLATVYFGNTKLHSIGAQAFANCEPLNRVTLSESVKTIGSAAFDGCEQLAKIIVNAVTPPTIGPSDCFDEQHYKNAILTVPAGSLAAYKTAAYWTKFFDEGTATSVPQINGSTESGTTTVYDLQGRKLAQPQKGVNIINGKKVLIK